MLFQQYLSKKLKEMKTLYERIEKKTKTEQSKA